MSDLKDKDLNIDNELGRQTITESAILKRLTGGSRQRIRIEEKNKPAYDVVLYAKLIFNVNNMPDSADESDAYNRRIVIIAFPNQFEGENEDKQLTAKLTTEEEKSGIFNILMNALRRIIKDKELYVNEKTIEDRRAKYERAVNPLKAFYDEAVWTQSEENHFAEKTVVFSAYVMFCEKYRLPKERYDHFCKMFKNKFRLTDFRPRDPNNKEKRLECWKGIILIPPYAPKTQQTTLPDPDAETEIQLE